MLTPILIAAGILAAAGLLAWLLSRSHKKDQPQSPQFPVPAPSDAPPEGPEEVSYRSLRHEAIDRIASRIRFSTRPVILASVKVGEERRSTPIPTGEVEIRPIREVAELPRALSSTHGYPDDMYFGQIASRQLPVVDHMETVDLVEDRYGPPRNALVYLSDVSPSMDDFGRRDWARSLCERILARAEAMEADTSLIPFGAYVNGIHAAKSPQEYAWLRKNLGIILGRTSGTNINRALGAGMDEIEGGDSTDRKILLVTDGTEGIDTSHTAQRLKELGIELHVVCIGKDHQGLRYVAAHYDLFPDQQQVT